MSRTPAAPRAPGRADGPPPRARATPVGTWRVRITFRDGPLHRQTVEGTVVFAPDARQTCLALAPYPGAGRWRAAAPAGFAFEFAEVVYRHDGGLATYAHVAQQATLDPGGERFTSSGTGEVYSAGGGLLATQATTVEATRLAG
jgi:hypothetical protein